jgi:hypothetical protein
LKGLKAASRTAGVPKPPVMELADELRGRLGARLAGAEARERIKAVGET